MASKVEKAREAIDFLSSLPCGISTPSMASTPADSREKTESKGCNFNACGLTRLKPAISILFF